MSTALKLRTTGAFRARLPLFLIGAFLLVGNAYATSPPPYLPPGLAQSQPLATPSVPLFAAPFISVSVGHAPWFDEPASVAVGDVDGDGIPDLLVGVLSYPTGFVSVEHGNGDGSFSHGEEFPANPISLTLADFNRDGSPDLAVADFDSVLIYPGDGHGRFRRIVAWRTAGTPAIGTGDLNADGIPDLVIGDFKRVTVWIGRGDGTFAPEAPVSIGWFPSGVVVADFNGDGVADVALSDYVRGFLVLKGAGNGALTAPQTYAAGFGSSAIAVGDLNQDGYLDLAVANGGVECVQYGSVREDSTVSVYFGRGDGTFEPQVQYEMGHIPTSVAIADLNHDARADLVVTNYLDPIVVCFGSTNPAGRSPVGSQTRAGLRTLRAGSTVTPAKFPLGTCTVRLGQGGEVLGPKVTYGTGINAAGLSVADLNGDNSMDLVVVNSGTENAAVLLGNGDGSFGGGTELRGGPLCGSVAVGDFNRDMFIDIAATSTGSNSISLFYGAGARTFIRGLDIPTGVRPVYVEEGDLNGDGKPDLAIANFGQSDSTLTGPQDGGFSILLGRGDGTFRSLPQAFTGSHPDWLAIGDLDGDGRPDLVLSEFDRKAVLVLRGNGDGTFERGQEISLDAQPSSVVIGDLNHDGIPDLWVTELGPFDSLVLGSGGGKFLSPEITYASGWDVAAVISDVNGDHLDDVLVTSSYTNSVRPILSSGGGSLTPGRAIQGQLGTLGLGVADVTGDGVPDIVASNFVTGSVSVRPGLGDGTFSSGADFGVGPGAAILRIAYLDGDGGPDVAVALSPTGSVRILWNQGKQLAAADARIFVLGAHRTLPIGSGPPEFCVQIEPVNNSFNVADVDARSVVMLSVGTGVISEIRAVPAKRSVVLDSDQDGAAEFQSCFARDDLAKLFGYLRGRRLVEVTVEGTLITGRRFRGPLSLIVVGTGKPVPATVTPNPLNPRGTLTFSLATQGSVTVRLYDLGGRSVRTVVAAEQFPAGVHRVVIDGRDARGTALASGVYFYRVETPEGASTGRFVVLK